MTYGKRLVTVHNGSIKETTMPNSNQKKQPKSKKKGKC